MSKQLVRRSGIQLQVLNLYRQALRAAKALEAQSRVPAIQYTRYEFRSNAKAIDKLDIQRVEFLIRQGKKQIERYSVSGVSGFSFHAKTGVDPDIDVLLSSDVSARKIASLR